VAFRVDSTVLKKQSDNNHVPDLNAPLLPLLRFSVPNFIYFSPIRMFSAKTNAAMEQLKAQAGLPVPFVPKEEGKVSWYACGPTMYGHSHLGHAKNYDSTDVIRRIMWDHFGYQVKFAMNIPTTRYLTIEALQSSANL
jgi:hypothetical protein